MTAFASLSSAPESSMEKLGWRIRPPSVASFFELTRSSSTWSKSSGANLRSDTELVDRRSLVERFRLVVIGNLLANGLRGLLGDDGCPDAMSDADRVRLQSLDQGLDVGGAKSEALRQNRDVEARGSRLFHIEAQECLRIGVGWDWTGALGRERIGDRTSPDGLQRRRSAEHEAIAGAKENWTIEPKASGNGRGIRAGRGRAASGLGLGLGLSWGWGCFGSVREGDRRTHVARPDVKAELCARAEAEASGPD